jgi:hypothetical protein
MRMMMNNKHAPRTGANRSTAARQQLCRQSESIEQSCETECAGKLQANLRFMTGVWGGRRFLSSVGHSRPTANKYSSFFR